MKRFASGEGLVVHFAGGAIAEEHDPSEEGEYRTLIELSPDALIVHNGDAILLANIAMASLIGAGRIEDVVGRLLLDFVAPSSRALVEERIRHMHSVTQRPLVDEIWKRSDGSEVHVEVAATPMPGLGPRAAMVIARDVTEQRRLQKERERLLSEKELLMREVHHRVANSLQLVQSLLTLQARGTESDEVRVHLRDACARIGTIGTLHHRLHQAGSVIEGDVRDYVGGVVGDLQKTLGGDRSRHILLNDCGVGPLIVEADSLMALGLITAEAVTNAFKYGEGAVRVSLKKEDAFLSLAVEDDGAGFPEGFVVTKDAKGLGMRMIAAMVHARGGRIEIGGCPHMGVPPSRIRATIPVEDKSL